MIGFVICMATAFYVVIANTLWWDDLAFSVVALVACGVGAVLCLWAELS